MDDGKSFTVHELKEQLKEKEREISRLQALLAKSTDQIGLNTGTDRIADLQAITPATKLTNNDISRYSRQLILPELGVKGQLKLKNVSVLVVGAGGLGCPAAIYLAAAGIGRLGVVDYDEVELSNLHRQILHTTDRIGISKALSISQSCYRLNSSVDYVPYQLQLSSSNALKIINKYDIVLDATDNVATRYLLNDACVLMKKPLVSGSALRFEGQLTVYNYAGGPCYRCLFPQPPPPETVTNCSDGGVIGVVPGIIGSLQALEAIKIATNIGASYSQRLLLFDGLDGIFRSVKLRPRSAACVVCGEKPSITQLIDYVQFCGGAASDKDQQLNVLDEKSRISAKEYKSMLNDGVNHLLLDVRQQVEMDICQLPHPALNIPFSASAFTKDIQKNTRTVIERLTDLQHQRKQDTTVPSKTEQVESSANSALVVCVCRRGNDSQLAVQHLQQEIKAQLGEDVLTGKGNTKIRVVDIRGGLHAWAKHVDDQFPVY